jgi:hypothetical protein
MSDDLVIPEFLRNAKRRAAPRLRRWSRMLPRRPEGYRWEAAERWEIDVPPTWSDIGKTDRGIGPGRRRVWVTLEGGWAHIRDAETYRKVRVSEWERVANKGIKVA